MCVCVCVCVCVYVCVCLCVRLFHSCIDNFFNTKTFYKRSLCMPMRLQTENLKNVLHKRKFDTVT